MEFIKCARCSTTLHVEDFNRHKLSISGDYGEYYKSCINCCKNKNKKQKEKRNEKRKQEEEEQEEKLFMEKTYSIVTSGYYGGSLEDFYQSPDDPTRVS
jgi:hypothetical protein